MNGFFLSYDSEDLIKEVREEIEIYGDKYKVFAISSSKHGYQFITDYVFDEEFNEFGLAPDEVAAETTLGDLLFALVEQDRII